ncbi:MAG TPA: hypothetical protein VKB05_12125 [Pyrinomonadaceae bacterium]|nr:hypothetical protein [Pyrinomonadaceae bacterium]
MKRSAQYSRITLPVLLIALLLPQSLLRAQTPNTNSTLRSTCGNREQDETGTEAGQRIKLYYMRAGTQIKQVLTDAAKAEGPLKGLIVNSPAEDEIILYGPAKQRSYARRIIATLDLPRPGIVMDMWGLQISSRNPEHLADVMVKVRTEIDKTQLKVRRFYNDLEIAARGIQLDAEFQNMLQENLFYTSALSPDHPLAMADILLRLTAAKEPEAALIKMANDLQGRVRNQRQAEERARERYGEKRKKSKNKAKDAETDAPALRRFLNGRGLTWDRNEWKTDGSIIDRVMQARLAVVEFGFQFGRLVHQPQCFSAYYLQQSAETLNSRLQASIDALNVDIQEMFVAPALDRIREIVREFDDVEYAQVGKTSVASLSGVTAEVASTSVNAFDVTPPLRLSELLKTADSLTKGVTPFVPADNVVGALPLEKVIGLIGALGEERSVWRELQSGVTISVTPNVLRNMTSAELAVDFKTGDPQVGPPPANVKPVSRVSKHEVKTSIYIEPLDFFDLSAFVSQSTLNGGRGYVPIIGPIWRGVFSGIPVAGDLFSWKRSPQTVFSQSLVLTTSFITPTAMGIAVLYPTELIDRNGKEFAYSDSIYKCQWEAKRDYDPRHSKTAPFGTCRPRSLELATQ